MARARLTRRGFLNLVGRAGGATAFYETMAAMGLLPAPTVYAGPPQLPHGLAVGFTHHGDRAKPLSRKAGEGLSAIGASANIREDV